MHITSHIVL